MSSGVLDKLRIKVTPKKLQRINIGVQKQSMPQTEAFTTRNKKEDIQLQQTTQETFKPPVIEPSVYVGQDRPGDFLWEIKEDIKNNVLPTTLYIFNDNDKDHATAIQGGGNAQIRPYNRYSKQQIARSAGICTGFKPGSNQGFKSLTENVRTIIDRDVGEIKTLLKTGNYNKIKYSGDKNGNLGTSIFVVGDDVKNYIVEQIKRLGEMEMDMEMEIDDTSKKTKVFLKTRVVDKTMENNIDRTLFINTIRNKLRTQRKSPTPEEDIDEGKVKILLEDLLQEIDEDLGSYSVKQIIQKLTDKSGVNMKPWKGVIKPILIEKIQNISMNKKPRLIIVRKLIVKLKLKQLVAPEQEEPQTQRGKKEKNETSNVTIERQTPKPIGVVQEGPATMVKIGDEILKKRMGTKSKEVSIKAGSYYLNNREKFVSFITSLFSPYKKELANSESQSTCERDDESPFSTMGHQKIVRDYISTYSPYRGVLLFHGLGSGKTCSSVAIAEGLKSDKQIIVMTPASLRTNYIEELKKCGDDIYKKNQFWEFVETKNDPELINTLSNALSLSVEYIKKRGGAWLMNVTKDPNFKDLNSEEKKNLDGQLDEMIRYKYKFMNYNGMRKSHLKALSQNYQKNPFDNKVVVIDEAHNFVSRIVNKMGREDTLSGKMYEYLMSAENARIVLLTGTPIINYPNEIAILFNILRGRIKTWTFKLTVQKGGDKISQQFFENLFNSKVKGGNIMDYIEYKPSSTTLVVTRNPFGFINKTKDGKHDGIKIGERGEISDGDFVKLITAKLKTKSILINPADVRVTSYKALPDKVDEFKSYFIDENNNDVKNMGMFKRRILGLTSYFRDMQSLMPEYSRGKNLHVVKIPMSDFQLGIYEEARIQERKLEKNNAKKRKTKARGADDDTVSTYRIFSRAFCNFVFPRPDIKRPLPGNAKDIEAAIVNDNTDEDQLDAASIEEKLDNVDGRYEADEVKEEAGAYDKQINEAIEQLQTNKDKYLTPEALKIYSPKFLNILENVQDVDHKGLHLIYSQFRTLEGVGIIKLVFEANGYAQFKVKRVGETWKLNISEEDRGKPMFALYTGTETREEKEIIRNVFNGTWKYVPSSLAAELQEISTNNLYGEIIKVLMITASGAEGISLKNVRYVHITEPYWHPVRTQQVIGRARRICSHQELPEALRTVDVFLYLMTFTQEQLKNDVSIELRLQDKSKVDQATPVTSDEALYEIASLKENITNKILHAVKESSIDCTLHSKVGDKEQLKCFTFGSNDPNKFAYQPSHAQEETDNVAHVNKKKITWKARELFIKNDKYAVNERTNLVYDYESYVRDNPVQVGKLEISGTGKTAKYALIRV